MHAVTQYCNVKHHSGPLSALDLDNFVSLSVIDQGPPIKPDIQRCGPWAPAKFRGTGVEVWVTAVLCVSCTFDGYKVQRILQAVAVDCMKHGIERLERTHGTSVRGARRRGRGLPVRLLVCQAHREPGVRRRN